MSTAVEPIRRGRAPQVRSRTGGRDVASRRAAASPRLHPLLHWSVAVFFILALLSGFAIYIAVALSLADAAIRRRTDDAAAAPLVQPRVRGDSSCSSSLQLAGADVLDARRQAVDAPFEDYVSNTEKLEPEYVDFFNAGQKLYFWAIGASAMLFLVCRESRCGSRRSLAGWRWLSVTCCTTSPLS